MLWKDRGCVRGVCLGVRAGLCECCLLHALLLDVAERAGGADSWGTVAQCGQ